MPTPAPPSTYRYPDLVRPAAAEHRPQPAAGSKPNPPLRSPIQSVWVASFSTVAMASLSSVVDTRPLEPTRRPSRRPSPLACHLGGGGGHARRDSCLLPYQRGLKFPSDLDRPNALAGHRGLEAVLSPAVLARQHRKRSVRTMSASGGGSPEPQSPDRASDRNRSETRWPHPRARARSPRRGVIREQRTALAGPPPRTRLHLCHHVTRWTSGSTAVVLDKP